MSVDDDDDMECSDEFHYMMDQSLACIFHFIFYVSSMTFLSFVQRGTSTRRQRGHSRGASSKTRKTQADSHGRL